MLQKCKNKYLSCVIAALIFTLPHIFNTDNISVLVMFIFPFLYGIFANEMFYTTKSIWMPTGFHWLWNYTITSLFLVTGTQSFIYVHIIAAMIIMTLKAFDASLKKAGPGLSGSVPDPLAPSPGFQGYLPGGKPGDLEGL